jgi:hypothetical protein
LIPRPGSRWAQGTSSQRFDPDTFDQALPAPLRVLLSSRYSSRTSENAWVNSWAWPMPNAQGTVRLRSAGLGQLVVWPLTPARPRAGSNSRNEATKLREVAMGGNANASGPAPSSVVHSAGAGWANADCMPSMCVADARGRYQMTKPSRSFE